LARPVDTSAVCLPRHDANRTRLGAHSDAQVRTCALRARPDDGEPGAGRWENRDALGHHIHAVPATDRGDLTGAGGAVAVDKHHALTWDDALDGDGVAPLRAGDGDMLTGGGNRVGDEDGKRHQRLRNLFLSLSNSPPCSSPSRCTEELSLR